MNLIANEIDGGDERENMPGGRALAKAMDRIKKDMALFCPLDIMDDDEGEPDLDRRLAEEAAIWAEVSPSP
jgi:hypothetical protein